MTAEMVEEVQYMLELFGLPYICAPMEAEAQCAALEAGGCVDGCVTDDSDAFLFGARTLSGLVVGHTAAYDGDSVRKWFLERQPAGFFSLYSLFERVEHL